MRKIKTITSISVILTILCCCIVTCYAKTSNYDDTYNCLDSSYEIEVSTEELENGVDITAYYTDNGKIVLKKANKNDKLLLGTTSYPTFSVSLVKIGNDRAILSWNATASCLKKVTGTVYCRDTKSFHQKHIILNLYLVHTQMVQKGVQIVQQLLFMCQVKKLRIEWVSLVLQLELQLRTIILGMDQVL